MYYYSMYIKKMYFLTLLSKTLWATEQGIYTYRILCKELRIRMGS